MPASLPATDNVDWYEPTLVPLAIPATVKLSPEIRPALVYPSGDVVLAAVCKPAV